MENILQSFKNLYNGENIVKAHFILLLWMFLPALTGAYFHYIDKDTPEKTTMFLLICGGILLLLSVVPLITLFGYYIRFYKNRLDNVMGIPMYENSIIKEGFKALPLGIVWSLYSVLLGLFLLAIPAGIFMVVYALNLGKLAIGLTVLFSVLWCLGMCVLGFILSPFVSYVYVEYAQNDKKIYNPLVIIDYMKKSFKDTIIVAIKFFLAGIVLNIGAAIFSVFIAIMVAIVGIVAALFATFPDTVVYHPAVIFVITLITSVSGIVKIYADAMTSCAVAENYVGIYNRLLNVQ